MKSGVIFRYWKQKLAWALFHESLANAMDKVSVGRSGSGGPNRHCHLAAMIGRVRDQVHQDVIFAAVPRLALAVAIADRFSQAGFAAAGQVVLPEDW